MAPGPQSCAPGGSARPVARQGEYTMEDEAMPTEQRTALYRQIAEICLTLRKRADFFLNNEPQNMTIEEFDRIAKELETVAVQVDSLAIGLAEAAEIAQSGQSGQSANSAKSIDSNEPGAEKEGVS